ncbi:MAG: alpha/beta fold hydrolase [Deltaproteobacteria bacterium]|nr:alpha/beta fold hydrolase [Deltaproteobacteria bacterium]
MPLIEYSTYRAPRFCSNPHVQTVVPSLLRRVAGVSYRRDRIEIPDGDFLDLDWSEVGSTRVAVILHGLEGNSSRSYVLGMVKALNRNGWDAAAMNFRSCSGECNRTLRFYHSGDTEDLRTVISHVAKGGKHSEVALIGFSLGGNVVLKYLGESGHRPHPSVRCAVTFSVPCDLGSCSAKMAEPSNRLYLKRFLRMLRKKIRLKMEIMPDKINDHGYRKIRTFKDYDDRYTAPIHGFADAEDYWTKCSCKQFLTGISVPALLVNARDDPFLYGECYPLQEADQNPHFYLETPTHGGHVGFMAFNERGEYWSEGRAVEFLEGAAGI